MGKKLKQKKKGKKKRKPRCRHEFINRIIKRKSILLSKSARFTPNERGQTKG